jgi:hypothetical protein
MEMDLCRMRGIGSKVLVRQHASARQKTGLGKVHDRMLDIGMMVQEKQPSNAAGSELGVLERLPGRSPDFVVEAQAKLCGIGLVFVVGELEMRLWRSCGLVGEVQATLREADIGIELEVRETEVGYMSRVGWEVLAILREVGSDIRRAARGRVREHGSRIVRVVLAI